MTNTEKHTNKRSIFVDDSADVVKKLEQFYKDNPYHNRKYYGVTKVLGETKSEEDKQIIENWRQNIGEEKADAIFKEAMEYGNSLDMIIEKYLQPNFNINDYKSEIGLKLFYQMKPILDKIKPIGMQVHLYSSKYEIQGFVDSLCYMKNENNEYELSIVDFKNARKKKDEKTAHDYALQVTIYAMILYQMTGILIKNLVIIVAVRNESRSQVFRFKLQDYLSEAKERIRVFNKNKKTDI